MPIPQPRYKKIIFISNHWQVVYRDDTVQRYDNHRFLAELGLFTLLQLTGPKSCRLVIFRDQMDEDSYRLLKVLEKVRR